MDEVQARVRRAVRRGVVGRVLLVVVQLVVFPLALLAVHELLNLNTATDPVFFGVWMGVAATIYHSGQSWKGRARVRSLLEPGETVRAVVPAQLPGATARQRIARGCFVVLTDRQVLGYAYNRALDVTVRCLAVAERADCVATSNPGGGTITLHSEAEERPFTVSARGWRALQKFLAELDGVK